MNRIVAVQTSHSRIRSVIENLENHLEIGVYLWAIVSIPMILFTEVDIDIGLSCNRGPTECYHNLCLQKCKPFQDSLFTPP